MTEIKNDEVNNKRYDVAFIARLMPDDFNEDHDLSVEPINGNVYISATSRSAVVKSAFVAVAEEVIKRGHILVGLEVTSVDETIDIPDDMKGETERKEID